MRCNTARGSRSLVCRRGELRWRLVSIFYSLKVPVYLLTFLLPCNVLGNKKFLDFLKVYFSFFQSWNSKHFWPFVMSDKKMLPMKSKSVKNILRIFGMEAMPFLCRGVWLGLIQYFHVLLFTSLKLLIQFNSKMLYLTKDSNDYNSLAHSYKWKFVFWRK